MRKGGGTLNGISFPCKVSAMRLAYTLPDEHYSRDHVAPCLGKRSERENGSKNLKRQHILSIDGQKEIEIHGEEGRENSSRYNK
jgi:hypothetical protein